MNFTCFLMKNSATIYSSFHIANLSENFCISFHATIAMNKPAFAGVSSRTPLMPFGGCVFSGKMAFKLYKITFHAFLALGYFCLTLRGKKVTQVIFLLVKISSRKCSFLSLCSVLVLKKKRSWIQVYHLVDSTIFSGPTNCITSYDMTSLGMSGNLFH